MIKEITTLIPVYNTQPDFLLESVFSILRQTAKIKNEIILINDCSNNENTLDVLRTLNHTQRVIIKGLDVNSGTSVALNEGHKLVRTEYVAIMGSDDVCDLTRFEKQISYLEKNKDVDVLGTNLFGFYENDIWRRKLFITTHKETPDFSKSWFINHGTVIYKQKFFEEMNGYDVTKRRWQDVDLWLRAKNTGKYKFANIEEILYAWRRYKQPT